MRNLRPPLARLNGRLSVSFLLTHRLQKSKLLGQILSDRRSFQIRIRMPINRPLLTCWAYRSLRVACSKYRFELRKVPSQLHYLQRDRTNRRSVETQKGWQVKTAAVGKNRSSIWWCKQNTRTAEKSKSLKMKLKNHKKWNQKL